MHAVRTMVLAWYSVGEVEVSPSALVEAAIRHTVGIADAHALVLAADHKSAVREMAAALRVWHGPRHASAGEADSRV